MWCCGLSYYFFGVSRLSRGGARKGKEQSLLFVCLGSGLASAIPPPLPPSAYQPIESPRWGLQGPGLGHAGSVGAALHVCDGQVFIAFTLPRPDHSLDLLLAYWSLILLKTSLREVSVQEKEELCPPPVQVVWQNCDGGPFSRVQAR